jgi:hypothetical protein
MRRQDFMQSQNSSATTDAAIRRNQESRCGTTTPDFLGAGDGIRLLF